MDRLAPARRYEREPLAGFAAIGDHAGVAAETWVLANSFGRFQPDVFDQ